MGRKTQTQTLFVCFGFFFKKNIDLGPVVQNLMLLANVTSILKYDKYKLFLLKKMWVAFAVQKLLTFFQQKYQCIWKYLSYNS